MFCNLLRQVYHMNQFELIIQLLNKLLDELNMQGWIKYPLATTSISLFTSTTSHLKVIWKLNTRCTDDSRIIVGAMFGDGSLFIIVMLYMTDYIKRIC